MTTLHRTAAALAAVALLALPARSGTPESLSDFQRNLGDKEGEANSGTQRMDGTSGTTDMKVSELLALAASNQVAAMEVLDKLITTESQNSGEMEERWQMACHTLFGHAREWYDDAERKMVERKENLSATQPFRDGMRKFMDDIEQNGQACMVWRRRNYTQQFDLENATGNYPALSSSAHQEMKEAQDALLAGEALLNRTGLTVKEVEAQLEKIRVAGRIIQACGNMAKERCSLIKDKFGDKAPELDKKVQQTLTDWKAVAERYTNLSKTLSPYPPKWAETMKKQWDGFLKVRKDFDTAYAPLTGGKLFDGLSLFKGVAYGELYKSLDAVKTKLIAKRLAIQRKTADDAAIQKALEEERRISAEERLKWREHDDTWGAEAQRDLELRANNVNSATREREIRLIEARMKSPTLARLFGTAARAAAGAAADAIRNAWQSAKKEADAEFDKWWKPRVERRAKLGLQPNWDED